MTISSYYYTNLALVLILPQEVTPAEPPLFYAPSAFASQARAFAVEITTLTVAIF